MVLEKTLPILLIFGIGLVLKHVQVLKKEHAPLLGQLIMTVALPATIVNALWATSLSATMLLLPEVGLVIAITLLGMGFLLAPLLGLQGKTRGAFLLAFPTLELGSVGYAVMFAVYGPVGLSQIALIDLGSGFFFFTVIAFLASLLGQPEEPFRFRHAFMTLVRNPVLWAYGIGIGLHFFHIKSALLSSSLSILAQAFLLLILFLIAAECEWKRTSLGAPLVSVYVKMCVGVMVGVGITWAFQLTGTASVAVVVGASLPASLMTVVYARKNSLDASFLASMLSVALPISIGLSSLIVLLAH